MQTFLPFKDFKESARVLDSMRLGKQRVETMQIARSLLFPEKVCPVCNGAVLEADNLNCPRCKRTGKVKVGHVNHPAAVQWKGHTALLLDYGVAICDEWIRRENQDTVREQLVAMYSSVKELRTGHEPWWLGLDGYHANHRGRLLYKAEFETTNPQLREKMMAWYRQFGWTDEPVLENYWPSWGNRNTVFIAYNENPESMKNT